MRVKFFSLLFLSLCHWAVYLKPLDRYLYIWEIKVIDRFHVVNVSFA